MSKEESGMGKVPQPTMSSAYFCPKCNSPTIDVFGVVIDGLDHLAECSACGWKGLQRDLLSAPFQHDFANDQETLSIMTRDLRNVMAKISAQVFGTFLLKWGFLDQPITPRQLARYLEAIAGAIVNAVVDTRKQIVEEKARERVGL